MENLENRINVKNEIKEERVIKNINGLKDILGCISKAVEEVSNNKFLIKANITISEKGSVEFSLETREALKYLEVDKEKEIKLQELRNKNDESARLYR